MAAFARTALSVDIPAVKKALKISRTEAALIDKP
jgi:hypothetical protein